MENNAKSLDFTNKACDFTNQAQMKAYVNTPFYVGKLCNS